MTPLIHPQFDPVALSIGPLAVRWYGLMYMVAFLLFMWLGRIHAQRRVEFGWLAADGAKAIDDLLFYGVLGVVLGGRLGQVLFYEPGYYFSHPAEIIAVWKGGMSFHGGFLGVVAAMILFARKHQRSFWNVADFTAPLVPLGLAAGRVGNFINAELVGRVAGPDVPWAMIFPNVDNLPRHPSQLYHVGLEGLSLFVVLWWFTAKPRGAGAASGLFLLGYGVCRFLVEYFREPDAGIFGWSYEISMGQWLSLPMIILGALLLWRAHRSQAVQA